MASETQSIRFASPGTGEPAPSVRTAFLEGVFRQEGDYWTVGYDGKASRLKDTKGFGYLAHRCVIRQPNSTYSISWGL
jgi:hypothetical protein